MSHPWLDTSFCIRPAYVVMEEMEHAESSLQKEKWTLSFDPSLKNLLIKAARRRGISLVTLLENIVREKFKPFGHADVEDSAAYVTALRKAGGTVG